MKLEDQILSIKQVQELQELGFDVEKHSSVIYAYATEVEQELISSKEFIELNGGASNVFGEAPYYFTMTIGDIINILPVKIEEDYSVKIEEDYFLSVNLEYCAYSMVVGVDTIFFTREKELINNLFKTLVWCIKQKHIAL